MGARVRYLDNRRRWQGTAIHRYRRVSKDFPTRQAALVWATVDGRAAILTRERIDSADFFDYLRAVSADKRGADKIRVLYGIERWARERDIELSTDNEVVLENIDAVEFMALTGFTKRRPDGKPVRPSVNQYQNFHDALFSLLRAPMVTLDLQVPGAAYGVKKQWTVRLMDVPRPDAVQFRNWNLGGKGGKRRGARAGLDFPVPVIKTFSVVVWPGLPMQYVRQLPEMLVHRTMIETSARRSGMLMLLLAIDGAVADYHHERCRRDPATGQFPPVRLPLATVWEMLGKTQAKLAGRKEWDARTWLRRELGEYVKLGHFAAVAITTHKGMPVLEVTPARNPRWLDADRKHRARTKIAERRREHARKKYTAALPQQQELPLLTDGDQ